MVSCQWRLTSGARAGQACGKGKKVFCKTHEPKAKHEVNRLFQRTSWGDSPQQEYLSRLIYEAKAMIDVANGLESGGSGSSAYRYSEGRGDSGMKKYSASWIAPKELDLKRLSVRGNLNTLDKVSDPRIVSRWLEKQLSKATVRGGEIFPERITKGQLQGIENVANIFNRRMDAGKHFQHFYSYVTDSRNTYNPGRIPLPFFQNYPRRGGNYHTDIEIINNNFCWWLQKCINYAPDYTAAWNWFVPAFSSSMVEHLDYIKRGYDVEAIKKDLSQLIRAYRVDANEEEQEQNRQMYANRYRKQ